MPFKLQYVHPSLTVLEKAIYFYFQIFLVAVIYVKNILDDAFNVLEAQIN